MHCDAHLLMAWPTHRRIDTTSDTTEEFSTAFRSDMTYSTTPGAIIKLVAGMQGGADIEEDDEERAYDNQDSGEEDGTQVSIIDISRPILCCIIASFNEARRIDFAAAALHEKP